MSSSSSSSSSSSAPRQQPHAQQHVQRVQHNAPTMRRQQQRAAAPSNRAIKQQKPVVKLTLASPYQLPTAQLNLVDSLRVLDLLTTELAPHYSVVKTVQVNNRRKRRREAREEARQAKRQHHQPSTAQPQQQTKPQHEDEKREADERTALIQDIVQGQPTSTQQPNGGLGLTLGLNSTTRTLETCQPTADTTINASPYALLVLTSCFPAALTAHFTYYSHYLRLPLLTLHSSISTQQLAHCLSSQLTSLLVMAVHRGSNASLLESLLPMARVLHIDWLDGQGRYEKLRIDKVERSEERAAKEEAKRKAREDAARAARPLSPKSIAAAVFKQKQKDKEAAEAAAKQASADRTTADSTSDTATVTAT